MNLALEDMTKEELIKVIKQSLAYQPTQKILRWIRWESMCEKSQLLMDESIKMQEEHTGKTDMASHVKWWEANNKFAEGMKLSDKADTYLVEELKMQCSGE